MKNTIFTKEEYMKQGFKEWETVYIKRFDILHNRFEELTKAEIIEYFFIQKLLKIWKNAWHWQQICYNKDTERELLISVLAFYRPKAMRQRPIRELGIRRLQTSATPSDRNLKNSWQEKEKCYNRDRKRGWRDEDALWVWIYQYDRRNVW